MKAYSFFAKVYDVFMNDIPYVDWLDGIEAYMERRNIQCHRVLELGCGTGRDGLRHFWQQTATKLPGLICQKQ